MAGLGGPMADLTFRMELVRFEPINDFRNAPSDPDIGSPTATSLLFLGTILLFSPIHYFRWTAK